jgi:2',3'-cyclic-nucleotide 2'-phosphodiesterase (5'-nucleotidase family)
MKKALLLLVLALMMVFVFAVPASADTYNLMAGQDIDVGDVYISQVGGKPTIEINLTGDWVLLKVAIDIEDEWQHMPLNNNDLPKVGQFEYQFSWDVTDYEQSTKITSNIAVAYPFDIAIHCKVALVKEVDVDPTILQEETAWAEGTCFNPDKNWSMYITEDR